MKLRKLKNIGKTNVFKDDVYTITGEYPKYELRYQYNSIIKPFEISFTWEGFEKMKTIVEKRKKEIS